MTDDHDRELQELRHQIERMVDKMSIMEENHHREHKGLKDTLHVMEENHAREHDGLKTLSKDTNMRLTWIMSIGTAIVVLLTFWKNFSAVFGG